MAHGSPIVGTPGTSIAAQCGSAATGTQVNSADLNDALTSIENDLATIDAGNVTIAGNKTFSGSTTLSGGVAGNTTFSGDVHIAQTHALVADGTGCTISGTWMQATSGKVSLPGRSALKPARVAIPDGNRKVSVVAGVGIDDHGARFTLPGTTGGKRTITLDSTVNVPLDGETLTFLCQPVGLTISSGIAFEFKNDSASLLARVYWDTANVSTQTGADNFWLTFEASGGAWTLAENSGSEGDAANTHWVGVRLS